MASVIKIKRSGTAASPSSLASGELAYSWKSDAKKLYFGQGDDGSGGATSIVSIGGEYYTKYLEHQTGVLTASSAILVDANKKVDELNVDNLNFNLNTISSTNGDGDIYITPDGTGETIVKNLNVNNVTITGLDPNRVILTTTAGLLAEFDSFTWANGSNLGIDVSITGSLAVDNININGNTISSTDSNGNIILDPNGSGLVSINNAYTLPATDGTSGYVLTTDGNGTVSWAAAAASLTVGGDVGTDAEVALLTESIDFVGDTGITTTVDKSGALVTLTIDLDDTLVTPGSYGSGSKIPTFTVDQQGRLTAAGEADVATNLTVWSDSTSESVSLLTESLKILGGEGVDTALTTDGNGNVSITISGEDATAAALAANANKGIASFDDGDFSVTAGFVSIKAGGVDNSQLANDNLTIGTTNVSLGATALSLAGLQQLDVDNIRINGNEISSTDANGNISLNPNGTGSVAVNSARITGLADPVDPQDAATKIYVDNAVSGLDWKQAVNLIATTNIALTGTSGTLTIDGHAALDDTDNNVYRLLLTGQSTSSENGIYLYTDNSTTYTLVRATDADTYQELIGSAVYVLEGNVYARTGWVQSNHYLTTFSGQQWTQFSGGGAYSAGDGLALSGTTFSVNVAAQGGIEISADNLQLKSTVAGDGLTYTNGVIAVVGTSDRITVTADAIDIASTYAGQNTITTLGTVTVGTWNANTVTVPYGGTGITTATARGILYGNGTSALGVTSDSTINGSFLKEDATGNPYWSNVIDGGTY